MEQATKKLKIDLDRIRAKARKVKQMSKKWECDSDENKWLSFVPDSNSDGDIKIDVNKCFKRDIAFKKKENEVYGCDHCPGWYHQKCLPAVVLTIAEAKEKALADIDIDCDYCTY